MYKVVVATQKKKRLYILMIYLMGSTPLNTVILLVN